MRRAAQYAGVAVVALAVAGCFVPAAQREVGELRGDHIMEQPQGIAPGANGLRLSPCACIDIEVDETGRVIG